MIEALRDLWERLQGKKPHLPRFVAAMREAPLQWRE